MAKSEAATRTTGPASIGPAADASASVYSNPYFKILLVINSFICAASLGLMVWASSFEDAKTGDMPRAKDRLFANCQYAFISTAGAFIGLLCGRAAAPDPSLAPKPA